MGRPKRRRGGGRVTPKKNRPRHDDEPGADLGDDHRHRRRGFELQHGDPDTAFQLEILTRDAEHTIEELSAADEADMDEADFWASCIQSAIATRRSPDGVDASAVLAHAERVGGPTGAVLAAAVAVYGPAKARPEARGALRRIRESCPDVPDWIDTLGEAEPLRATKTTDRWGEQCGIRIDYRRPDGTEHAVSVSIQPFCLAAADRFLLSPHTTRRPTADDEDQLVEDLSLADARAIIEAGLLVHDRLATDDEDDDFDAGSDHDLRALLEQRLALLPEGGRAPATPPLDATESAGHIGDFLSHGLRLGEHPDEIHDLGRTMVGFAMMCHDRDILHWTPPRVAAFLEDWIPDHGLFCEECGEAHEHPPDEEWLTTVESAFPRWMRHAAERRGLSDDVLEANLATARESLRQMRLHATGSPVRLR